FATPADVIEHMNGFAGLLPPGAWDVLATQLQDVASRRHGTLTATATLSLVLALWSARAGMASLMTATHVGYSEHEKRGFVRQVMISLVFTAGAILGLLAMVLLGIAVPL